VRRDETRGANESSASVVGGAADEGAADEGGPISELSVAASGVTGGISAAFGWGRESVGGDSGNVGSGGGATGSGTAAGAEAGAAFFFSTDRREPDDGASSEASIVAGSWWAVSPTGG
jgi:hypothetical protein